MILQKTQNQYGHAITHSELTFFEFQLENQMDPHTKSKLENVPVTLKAFLDTMF